MPLTDTLTRRLERLGLRIPQSLLPFIAVGFAGLATHTAVFSLLFHAGWLDKSESWLCALAVATVVTWALNRRFSFAATGRRSSAEILRYVVVTLVAQGINYASFMTLSNLLPHLLPQVAILGGSVIATAFSYTGQRFFTFAPYKRVEPVAVGDVPVLVAAPDGPC